MGRLLQTLQYSPQDAENGLVETVGEGERGTNRHGSTGLYTLPRVGQSASGGLLRAQNSSELTSVLRGPGGEGGG